jgi:predicted membrane-bound spermidine synthase
LFETLWFRLAGLTFGNSLWASSLVLAAFMGGLGLGNLLALRYGPRLKKPLVVYAMLEVVIGLVGFLLVLIFPLLTPALVPIFRPFLDSPVVLQFLRLVFAFALLLIPATAMGMTLPLLVKTLSVRDENFGRVLGRLYGFNTLGAVAGALSGELLLIGMLGLRGTGLVAVLLNIVAVVASFTLARVIVSKDETPDSTSVKLTPAARSGPVVWSAPSRFRGGLVPLSSTLRAWEQLNLRRDVGGRSARYRARRARRIRLVGVPSGRLSPRSPRVSC